MLKFKCVVFVILLIFISQKSFAATKSFLDWNFTFLNSTKPIQHYDFAYSGLGISLQYGKYSVFDNWRFGVGVHVNICNSNGQEKDKSNTVVNVIINPEFRYSFDDDLGFTPYVGLGAGLTVLASDRFYDQPIGLGVNLLAGVYIPLSRALYGVWELHLGLVSPIALIYFEGESYFPYYIFNTGIGYKF